MLLWRLGAPNAVWLVAIVVHAADHRGSQGGICLRTVALHFDILFKRL